jgi:hypothetical protein
MWPARAQVTEGHPHNADERTLERATFVTEAQLHEDVHLPALRLRWVQIYCPNSFAARKAVAVGVYPSSNPGM